MLLIVIDDGEDLEPSNDSKNSNSCNGVSKCQWKLSPAMAMMASLTRIRFVHSEPG